MVKHIHVPIPNQRSESASSHVVEEGAVRTALTTHLRTSNPIESAFATVRHRTVRMKGALSQDTARLMVFKLIMAAAKNWRRLQGQNQCRRSSAV